MTLDDLREDISIEFARIDETLAEIRLILRNERESVLTRSDVTAGATYLAQCYSGIENVLKRITKYCNLPLPSGSFWHAELVGMFQAGEDRDPRLPELADASLFPLLTTLRKFRHVVAHGYAVTFDREAVLGTLRLADGAVERFKKNVLRFLGQTTGRV